MWRDEVALQSVEAQISRRGQTCVPDVFELHERSDSDENDSARRADKRNVVQQKSCSTPHHWITYSQKRGSDSYACSETHVKQCYCRQILRYTHLDLPGYLYNAPFVLKGRNQLDGL